MSENHPGSPDESRDRPDTPTEHGSARPESGEQGVAGAGSTGAAEPGEAPESSQGPPPESTQRVEASGAVPESTEESSTGQPGAPRPGTDHPTSTGSTTGTENAAPAGPYGASEQQPWSQYSGTDPQQPHGLGNPPQQYSGQQYPGQPEQHYPGQYSPQSGQPMQPGQYPGQYAGQAGAAAGGAQQPGQYGAQQPPPQTDPQHPYAAQQHPYATQQYPYATQQYPQPPVEEPPRSGRGGARGRLLVGMTALALVAGLVGGAGGTYAVHQITGGNGVVTSLDQQAPASENSSSAPSGSVQSVADTVLPSVVQIQVQTARGASGSGSGIIISEDGYILTNNHVVEGASQAGGGLVGRFNDGQVSQLNVVGTAPWSDLAVVKADVTGLTPAELGNSGDLDVGSGVVAIGSPYGLSGTVTSGIISAKDRPVRAGGQSGTQATVLNALQTDAAINPGNSGGPLVDMNGRVIGINSAIYSPSSSSGQAGSVGLGFAIPIDHARRIGKQLIEDGSAARTTLGVQVRVGGNANGGLVMEVPSGGPAAEAGVKSGDVITKVNDRTITSGDELIAAIRSYAPGDTVTLTITNKQGGNKHTVEATLTGQE
ncbi:putative serine protease PepD [Actinopolyspora mzabensis]|uniref:Putative serine protease PepD n=1 Tax=Actinopolyspora mzabensis TaxID=995066 RepID=A0A1G9CUF9_ACTMZ|nr:trypsin-like peptidase domain-containing protein [Actinopolyspora mzabensis]SDK55034.1 putative serine protease PepD [Actinopolyspora mzabensis]